MGERRDSILQQRLRELMAAKRLTGRGLSEAAGLGETAVKNIFSGKSRNPRQDTLMKLAGVLGCPVGYLMGELGVPRPVLTEGEGAMEQRDLVLQWLESTDAGMARVIEDLVDILVTQGLIDEGDIDPHALARIRERRQLRTRLI